MASADAGRAQPSGQPLWEAVLHHLSSLPGSEAPPPWLTQARLQHLEGGHAHLALPPTAPAPTLDPAVRDALERALAETLGRQVQLHVHAGEDAPWTGPTGEAAAPGPALVPPRPRLALNPLYTFENFVTGPCNRMAHAAALAVSDLPGRAYNPLFIHSSVGLGKSHLMQAICHKLQATRPDIAIMYISCEEFVNRFIAAIEQGRVEAFRHTFRLLDVLVIDDIHFLAEKDRTQEEFFHTFNALYQAQKQVVLSSDSPPHEIPRIEQRLVSRFNWGLVARIDRPSYETRVAIVRKKAKLRGRDLPEDVVHLIATAVDTNIRELEGAVIRVLGYAALSDREVTMDLAREALRDLVHDPGPRITLQAVTDAVLARFGVRLADLQSKRRTQSVALPRQIAMFLARRLTNHSLEEIGAFFGGRDHTTVLHAERKIRRQIEADPAFRGLVEAIEREILRK